MPTIVWISGAIGTSIGIFAVASADSFPAIRAPLRSWGSTVLCVSAALFGFGVALVSLV